MHEFSLAQSVLNIVLNSARENSLAQVTEVRLDVGSASGVSVDALSFAWSYLRGNETLTRQAELEINKTIAEGVCNVCGHHCKLDDWIRICPACGALAFKPVSGTEFMVTGITGE